jgi:hypothetical protein
MAPKPKSETPPAGVPSSFPQTTPGSGGGDIGSWVLTAINRMEGTLGRIEANQETLREKVAAVQTKLDGMKDTVSSHEKWVHTFKYALAVLGILITWLVAYVVGPWLRAKFFD